MPRVLSRIWSNSVFLRTRYGRPRILLDVLHRRYSRPARHASSTTWGEYSIRFLKTLGIFSLSFVVSCYTLFEWNWDNLIVRVKDVKVRSSHSAAKIILPTIKLELVALLGEEGVDDDVGIRIAHSSTEWSPAPNGDKDCPSLVVYPKSTKDVSNIMKICHRYRMPVIAFSGGTSLEATLAAQNNEICIDFGRMNEVIELHSDDMDVVVQPGVGYQELNEQLAAHNLFFPPDPGPGAQIGGMVSQSCSGTNAYRYGTMKDWVLGLTVVLADGTIIKTRHRPRKSNAGYDLTRLFIGSEGTLGLITEASLKLTNKPENVQVAVAAFPSTQQAAATATRLVQKGLPLAAIELLDGMVMHAVNQGGQTNRTWPEKPTLFLKFSGSPTQIQEQIAEVQTSAKANGCVSFDFSQDDEEADSLWHARKTILWSMISLKRDPDDKFIGADTAVPISRLAELFEATKAKLDESDLVGFCLGHAGDGNIHASVLYGEKDKEKAEKIIEDVQQMGIEMGGTVTGEHGIGLINRDALIHEVGEETVDTMRSIKLALDPWCLLNPGKVMRLWPEDRVGLKKAKGTKEVGDSQNAMSSR